MAKTKPINSFALKSTGKIVQLDSCVLMRPSEPGADSYVAKVKNIEADKKNHVTVGVQWYYRPHETLADRCAFHGAKELFLSDHFDHQLSAECIEDTCIVHSLEDYTKLDFIRHQDFYSRFSYIAKDGGFEPEFVEVFCKCEMPYNPDELMVLCEGCRDWFHPRCLEMTIEDASNQDPFLCAECAPPDDDQIEE